MDPRITDSTLIALGGLIGVVALLFLAITRYRWHVFIALLGPILLFALLPGIDRAAFIGAFEVGFGKTVQSIAVVIVVGTILAEGLKHTGGIERITVSMIRWVGEKRMPLALTLSGWVIGIPIFSDVGYVILNPLVHSAAIRSGLNMSVMSTGLIGAMQLTHAMVPPTPAFVARTSMTSPAFDCEAKPIRPIDATAAARTLLDVRCEKRFSIRSPFPFSPSRCRAWNALSRIRTGHNLETNPHNLHQEINACKHSFRFFGAADPSAQRPKS